MINLLPVIIFIVLGLFAAVFSGLGIEFLRRYAERQRVLIDIPNERSSHSQPKPRGGGIMIVLITLIGVLGLLLIGPARSMSLLTFLICGGIIAFVGWIDDMRSLSTTLRLAIQVLCALVSILGIGYFNKLTVGNSAFSLGLVGIPFTIVWLVGLTNAYNFMDGIDGIAGGQAVVGGLAWLGFGLIQQVPIVSIIGLLIASSSLGFLWHNWQPSRIIMGDVGATFLGYSFAVLPLLFENHTPILRNGLWFSMLVLWAFLADTGITMLRRALRRENIFQAHRSHFYQRLVISGWSHARVSALYIVLSVLGSLFAIWLSS
ncbi:MAG: glycosyltransferase family 4 protein [Chloroflexi bacterium]|nr:glycosyltransferase family 4 protein [Chloroflexota bacterium]